MRNAHLRADGYYRRADRSPILLRLYTVSYTVFTLLSCVLGPQAEAYEMPRQADPFLETQILDAAARLWRKGGTGALTMRAVAQAAHTTTPTIYRRFKDRQEILRALLRRTQQDVVNILKTCRSPQEASQRCVAFALSHPHEYELSFAHEFESSHAGRHSRSRAAQAPRPRVEVMKAKLAEWLGGSPEDYKRLPLAL
jgi:AcrR family transcriptional regulator